MTLDTPTGPLDRLARSMEQHGWAENDPMRKWVRKAIAERAAAEAELRETREALERAVVVLEAISGYVTGYDAVPYQDALRDAREILASGQEKP